MSKCVYKDGIPTCTAGEDIAEGSICTLKDGVLVPWKTADDTSSKTVQLFVAQFDAKKGEHVSVHIAGNTAGTILVPATAGTYTQGAQVFAADGGKVAATGTRVAGTALETVTLADAGILHIVPQHVPVP